MSRGACARGILLVREEGQLLVVESRETTVQNHQRTSHLCGCASLFVAKAVTRGKAKKDGFARVYESTEVVFLTRVEAPRGAKEQLV